MPSAVNAGRELRDYKLLHAGKAEMVTNGDFSNGVAGFVGSSATLANVGGQLQVTSTAATGAGGQQVINGFVVGGVYKLAVGLMANASNFARVGILDPGVGYPLLLDVGTFGASASGTFTATKVSYTLTAEVASAGAWGGVSAIATFDNLSVTRVS